MDPGKAPVGPDLCSHTCCLDPPATTLTVGILGFKAIDYKGTSLRWQLIPGSGVAMTTTEQSPLSSPWT